VIVTAKITCLVFCYQRRMSHTIKSRYWRISHWKYIKLLAVERHQNGRPKGSTKRFSDNYVLTTIDVICVPKVD